MRLTSKFESLEVEGLRKQVAVARKKYLSTTILGMRPSPVGDSPFETGILNRPDICPVVFLVRASDLIQEMIAVRQERRMTVPGFGMCWIQLCDWSDGSTGGRNALDTRARRRNEHNYIVGAPASTTSVR